MKSLQHTNTLVCPESHHLLASKSPIYANIRYGLVSFAVY
jgi:hypothetical protein